MDLKLLTKYKVNKDLMYLINDKLLDTYSNKNVTLNVYDYNIVSYDDFTYVFLDLLTENCRYKLERIIDNITDSYQNSTDDINIEMRCTYKNKKKYMLFRVVDIDMEYISIRCSRNLNYNNNIKLLG